MLTYPSFIPSLSASTMAAAKSRAKTEFTLLKSRIKARPVAWGVGLVAFLLAVDALSMFVWMGPLYVRAQDTAASAASVPPSSNVAGILDKVRSAGGDISLLPSGRIRRPPLSAPGVIATLKNDNIQIFEYPNAAAAGREAEEFLGSYRQMLDHRSWSPSPSLYIDGRVIVLYVGSNTDIISVLNNALGAQGNRTGIKIPSQ